MKPFTRILSLTLTPLLLASIACAATGTTTIQPTPIVVTVVVPATQVGAPDTQIPPTEAVAPTQAQVEPNATPISIPGPTVNYNNVALTLDINVARGVGAKLVPASEVSSDAPPFALNPQYTQFTLDGYPVTQQYRQPTINVYKLDEILKLTPDLAPEVDKFKALLQSQSAPAAANQIPTIPITNAGQMFHSQVKFLNFNGGSGVRIITQYAQAPMALNNQDTFYLFEGLTSDGVYYVQASLPINSTSLGFTQDDFGAFTVDFSSQDAGTQFEAYLADKTAALDALGPDGFTPNLDALDGILSSLTIK